jgi:hypothetical protein
VIKFTSCLSIVGDFLRVLPASSTTKTGRHDIAEILLKVALRHQKSNKKIIFMFPGLVLEQLFISGRVKLVLLTQTSLIGMMQSCKCFTYDSVSNVIV